jgi:hypothetical protein
MNRAGALICRPECPNWDSSQCHASGLLGLIVRGGRWAEQDSCGDPIGGADRLGLGSGLL